MPYKYQIGDRVRFSHDESYLHFTGTVVVPTYEEVDDDGSITLTHVKPDDGFTPHRKENGRLWLDDCTVIDNDGTVHCLPNEIVLMEQDQDSERWDGLS